MPRPPEQDSPDRDTPGVAGANESAVTPSGARSGSPLRPAKTPPPPRDVSARIVIAVGTAAFFVVFVVLLPFWSWLGRHDHRIWLWTCLAGWVLGLLGLVLVGRHRRAGRVSH